jgi:cytochrome oxidase assembly protein ShyY1
MPPDNGEYMVAAYALTAVILGGYAVMLWRRARGAR